MRHTFPNVGSQASHDFCVLPVFAHIPHSSFPPPARLVHLKILPSLSRATVELQLCSRDEGESRDSQVPAIGSNLFHRMRRNLWPTCLRCYCKDQCSHLSSLLLRLCKFLRQFFQPFQDLAQAFLHFVFVRFQCHKVLHIKRSLNFGMF